MRGKRNITILFAAVFLAFGMTGCAENQIPDLSDDEVQAVGEFVALSVMKYDISHRSRLMDLTQPAESLEEEGSAEVPESEEIHGMAPVDDTPVVNSAEGGESGENVSSSYTLEEVVGLPEGVTVHFQGQALYDSYPSEEDVFSLNAVDGKKLLVLNFSLVNAGSQEQAVDILDSETAFHIMINGEYSRRALPTILLNDLSTYVGSVPAGERMEAVLVVEVDSNVAENISSLSLNVKNGEKAVVLDLFSEPQSVQQENDN